MQSGIPNGRVFWVLATVALAVVLAGLAVVTPSPALIVAGVVAMAVVIRWPTATMVAALIACQEISDASGLGANIGSLQTFGNALYFEEVGQVPILVLLMVFAAIAGLGHGGLRRTDAKHMQVAAVAFVGSLGIAIMLIALVHLPKPLTVLNQDGRPYLLAVAALVLAGTTVRQPGGWSLVMRTAGVTLVLVAVAGALLLLAGGVQRETDGSIAVFHDSALPAVSGAVFLGLLLGVLRGHWRWVLLIATGCIVFLSGRRNVWLALVLVGVVVLLIRLERIAAALRAAVIVGVLVAGLRLFSPGLVGEASQRLLVAFTTLQGLAADPSTTGHIDDLRYGWTYAVHAPFLGFGPAHPPLPGMAVQGATFYVHNAYLMDWLRFGVVGLAVSVTLGLTMFVFGARTMRRPQTSVLATVSSLFLMIAPVCAMSAAFFNTTQRWPALLGLAAGAVFASRSRGTSFAGQAGPDATVPGLGADASATPGPAGEPIDIQSETLLTRTSRVRTTGAPEPR